jgi:hypothetical protein
VSAKPSPKPNPFDFIFQSVWLRLTYLLFWATYITVFWFVLGPASKVATETTPLYAVSVAWGTCALGVAVPAPAVMRRVPRGWFRVSRRERVLHRMLGIGVFGWLRMESPRPRTPAGILGQKARLTLPGTVGASRCCLTRNLLCHPCSLGSPRTFHQASLERGAMDAVAGCSRSSLPCSATALHHASTPTAAG